MFLYIRNKQKAAGWWPEVHYCPWKLSCFISQASLPEDAHLCLEWPGRNVTPSLSSPSLSLASCFAGSGGFAECTNECKNEQTNETEQTQSSHLTLPELICFAWRECGCVPDPMHGYIPWAAKVDQQQMQEITHAKREEQIRLFLKEPFSDSPPKGSQNALVVSCPTGKIKLEGWTSWAPCVYLRVSHPKGSILRLAPVVGNRKPGTFPQAPESKLMWCSLGLPAPFFLPPLIRLAVIGALKYRKYLYTTPPPPC